MIENAGRTPIISIHALRVEGDAKRIVDTLVKKNFYPRPPGGGRPISSKAFSRATDFYPRPPGGGRQLLLCLFHALRQISIHALRVEGDL